MVGNWAGNYSIWRVYDLYNELSKASIVYLQAEFDNIKQVFRIHGEQPDHH